MLKKFLILKIFALVCVSYLSVYSDCISRINAENPGDQAGTSVALNADGDTLAIGEPGWSGNKGRVRIFQYNGSSWYAAGSLPGDGKAGSSVALNAEGFFLAEGEPYWNNETGRVRVFTSMYNPSSGIYSWSEIAEIDGQNAIDWAGFSVALHTNEADNVIIIAIGEPLWDNGQESGRVRIIKLIYDPLLEWNVVSTDIIPGQSNGDQAGWSVALNADGTILAIGEPGWDGSLNDGSKGRVRIFQYNGSSWNQITEIDGESYGDNAGSSVALNADGTIVASGEPGCFDGAGRVRIFQQNGSSWSQITKIDGQNGGNGAGYSVALSDNGNILAEGEPGWNTFPGRVRIFKNDGNNNWSNTGIFTGIFQGVNSLGYAGFSVALSADGLILAEGEPGVLGDPGLPSCVRIFRMSCSSLRMVPFFSSNPKKVGSKLRISDKANIALESHSPEIFKVEPNGHIKL